MRPRFVFLFVLGGSALGFAACGGSTSGTHPELDAAADGAAADGAVVDGAAADSGTPDGTVLSDGGTSGDATIDGTIADAGGDAAAADATVGPDAADAAIAVRDASVFALVSTYLGGLYVFKADPATGALALDASPVLPGAHLYGLAVHPSRRFIYAVGFDENQIFGFRLDGDGALSPVPGSPFAYDGGPIAVSVDPLGRFVYAGNVDGKSVAILRVDADSGALAPVPGSPFAVTTPVAFLAGEPSGRFVYMTEFGAAGVHAFALDGDAGSIAELDASPFARTEVFGGAVAVHPSGKYAYAGKLSSFSLGADGTLTALPGLPLDASFHSDPNAIDLVVDPQGRHAYGVDSVSGTVAAFGVDPDSGVLTPAPGSPYDAGPFPYSVGVDPEGRFVYVPGDDGSGIAIFAVDPASGALAPVPGSPFTFDALQPQVIMTPAPAR